ncbi:MAG: hypothetical protein ACP5GZ_01940 [Vulcanisaeta sp.]|jgi:hypothetical protein|uniref:Uncharacterized protein n=1 Tax=Vulcanisaeta moutnovskia (strain 768-28) TaxID=985053 RepID=F0QX58_VULM7|nr:hypothetical protein [Vulcanisaeta moutnovskia]ADY02347.1 hypothetical protein VMUT_2150 [Vulcanisaeta moutnovskia 768-28]
MRCDKETLVASGFGYFVRLIRKRCLVNDGLSIAHIDPKVIGVWKSGELIELDYDWKASLIDYDHGVITIIIRSGSLETVIRIRSNRIIDAFSMEVN